MVICVLLDDMMYQRVAGKDQPRRENIYNNSLLMTVIFHKEDKLREFLTFELISCRKLRVYFF